LVSLISEHVTTGGVSELGPFFSEFSFSYVFSVPISLLNLTKAIGAPVLAGSFS